MSAVVGVPLRLGGTLGAPTSRPQPVRVAGPGTTPTPDGARVDGTLAPGQSIELTVTLATASRLDLDLTVTPVLDPRTLVPPGGAATWAAWAAGRPAATARRSALDLLVQTAATGARASSYAPYLGADLPGTGATSFRYAFATAPIMAPEVAALAARPAAIVVTGIALLLVLAGGAGLWRLS